MKVSIKVAEESEFISANKPEIERFVDMLADRFLESSKLMEMGIDKLDIIYQDGSYDSVWIKVIPDDYINLSISGRVPMMDFKYVNIMEVSVEYYFGVLVKSIVDLYKEHSLPSNKAPTNQHYHEVV